MEKQPRPFSTFSRAERAEYAIQADIPAILANGDEVRNWLRIPFNDGTGRELIHIHYPGSFFQDPSYDKVELMSPDMLTVVPVRRDIQGKFQFLTMPDEDNPSSIRFPQDFMRPSTSSVRSAVPILQEQTGYTKPAKGMFVHFPGRALDHSFGVAKAIIAAVEIDIHLPSLPVPNKNREQIWKDWKTIKSQGIYHTKDLGTIATIALMEQYLIRSNLISHQDYVVPKDENNPFFREISSIQELTRIKTAEKPHLPSQTPFHELSEEEKSQAVTHSRVPVELPDEKSSAWIEVIMGPDKKIVRTFDKSAGEVTGDAPKLESHGGVMIVPIRFTPKGELQVMSIRETRTYSSPEKITKEDIKRCFPQGFVKSTDVNSEGNVSPGITAINELREEAGVSIKEDGLIVHFPNRTFDHTFGITDVDIFLVEVPYSDIQIDLDELNPDSDEKFEQPIWTAWRPFKDQVVGAMQDRRTIAAATIVEQYLIQEDLLNPLDCFPQIILHEIMERLAKGKAA